jgi:uncharacterized protein YkwD
MSWRRLLGLMGVLALLGSCATARPVRYRAEPIPLPEEASVYRSDARPDGAVGGSGVEQIAADISAALAKRGMPAQADGALSAAASWALREANQGRPQDPKSLDAAARHYGFGGAIAGFAVWNTADEPLWRRQLDRIPANIPITRYGVRVSPSGASAAVAFGSAEIDYEPIPRALEPGQTVTLKGQVGPRFAFCRAFFTKPDGTVEEKRMPDRSVTVSFPLEVAGQYRLEVMGDGPTGPVIVTNLPLFVGVPEPSLQVGAAVSAVDPEQAEARALVLLNDARRAAGLSALAPDNELREIALAHSEDMVDHEFFSHVSPSTGTPDDRARRAGVLVLLFGENIGLAPTPEAIHDGLMDSPGHRANMLRAEFTHVGIGAVNGPGGLVLTMNFGRRPKPGDVPTTAAQVEAAIAALRSERSLPAVTVDPIYRAGAQAGADAIADGDSAAEVESSIAAAIQREVDRLRSSRPATCSSSLELLELSQLASVAPLLRKELRRIGVGARVHRDARGTRLSTFILFEGVPCGR